MGDIFVRRDPMAAEQRRTGETVAMRKCLTSVDICSSRASTTKQENRHQGICK